MDSPTTLSEALEVLDQTRQDLVQAAEYGRLLLQQNQDLTATLESQESSKIELTSSYDNLRQDCHEAQIRVKSLEQTNSALTSEVGGALSTATDIIAQVTQLKEALERTNLNRRSINRGKAKSKWQGQCVDELETELETCKLQLDRQEAALDKLKATHQETLTSLRLERERDGQRHQLLAELEQLKTQLQSTTAEHEIQLLGLRARCSELEQSKRTLSLSFQSDRDEMTEAHNDELHRLQEFLDRSRARAKALQQQLNDVHQSQHAGGPSLEEELTFSAPQSPTRATVAITPLKQVEAVADKEAQPPITDEPDSASRALIEQLQHQLAMAKADAAGRLETVELRMRLEFEQRTVASLTSELEQLRNTEKSLRQEIGEMTVKYFSSQVETEVSKAKWELVAEPQPSTEPSKESEEELIAIKERLSNAVAECKSLNARLEEIKSAKVQVDEQLSLSKSNETRLATTIQSLNDELVATKGSLDEQKLFVGQLRTMKQAEAARRLRETNTQEEYRTKLMSLTGEVETTRSELEQIQATMVELRKRNSQLQLTDLGRKLKLKRLTTEVEQKSQQVITLQTSQQAALEAANVALGTPCDALISAIEALNTAVKDHTEKLEEAQSALDRAYANEKVLSARITKLEDDNSSLQAVQAQAQLLVMKGQRYLREISEHPTFAVHGAAPSSSRPDALGSEGSATDTEGRRSRNAAVAGVTADLAELINTMRRLNIRIKSHEDLHTMSALENAKGARNLVPEDHSPCATGECSHAKRATQSLQKVAQLQGEVDKLVLSKVALQQRLDEWETTRDTAWSIPRMLDDTMV